jgi:hypothetical protein
MSWCQVDGQPEGAAPMTLRSAHVAAPGSTGSLRAFSTLRPRQDAQTTFARHVRDVLGVHGERTRPACLSAADPQPAPCRRSLEPPRTRALLLLNAAPCPLLRPPSAPVLRAVVKAARRLPVLQRRAPCSRDQARAQARTARAAAAREVHNAAVWAAAALGRADASVRYGTYDGSSETDVKAIVAFGRQRALGPSHRARAARG